MGNQNSPQIEHRNRAFITAIVALIFSAVSLIISAATFYFQHLRKYDNLKATIVSLAPNYPLGVKFTADIVFTNNGNRKCSVTSVDLEQENLDAKEEFLRGKLTTPCLTQPAFTLNDSDAVTKQFQIGSGKILIRNAYAKKGERIEWRLVFGVVDSDGKYHQIRLPVLYKTIGESKADEFKIPSLPTTVQLLPSATKEHHISFPRDPAKSGDTGAKERVKLGERTGKK